MSDNINLLLKKLHNIPNTAIWDTKKLSTVETILEESMHLSKRINSQLKSNKEISLWLTVNPYVSYSNNESLNVSASIEQLFLENVDGLPFNSKGKNKPQGVKVEDIIMAHKDCD